MSRRRCMYFRFGCQFQVTVQLAAEEEGSTHSNPPWVLCPPAAFSDTVEEGDTGGDVALGLVVEDKDDSASEERVDLVDLDGGNQPTHPLPLPLPPGVATSYTMEMLLDAPPTPRTYANLWQTGRMDDKAISPTSYAKFWPTTFTASSSSLLSGIMPSPPVLSPVRSSTPQARRPSMVMAPRHVDTQSTSGEGRRSTPQGKGKSKKSAGKRKYAIKGKGKSSIKGKGKSSAHSSDAMMVEMHQWLPTAELIHAAARQGDSSGPSATYTPMADAHMVRRSPRIGSRLTPTSSNPSGHLGAMAFLSDTLNTRTPFPVVVAQYHLPNDSRLINQCRFKPTPDVGIPSLECDSGATPPGCTEAEAAIPYLSTPPPGVQLYEDYCQDLRRQYAPAFILWRCAFCEFQTMHLGSCKRHMNGSNRRL